jgi:microcystin degradation protein MlrC
MARTLQGEASPVMAAEFLPLAVNIEQQATAERPLRELYARSAEQLTWPGLLSLSPVLGFPYADVPELGAAVIAVASHSDWAAQNAARLADWWWGMRADYRSHLTSVQEALNQAAERVGPVCLLDMGDNVGGGSPGDGTILARELHRRQLGPSCVVLADPESQQAARTAGVGNRVRLRAGGKTDTLHGESLKVEFTVRGFSDGQFTEPNPRHGGFTRFDQGPTTIVESDTGLTLVLTSNRMAPFSLNQLTSCGLDPARFRVLVAKGVHAPVAAYAPVCQHLIRVDTPGVTSADLSRLAYRYRRRPMFPIEPETAWVPGTG